VSQHGSFPGRPRGRRARRDNDAPPWQGHDATPADEREFPDLPPIRPRETRSRDGRVPEDWQAQQAGQQGQQGPGGWQPGGYPAAGGYPGDGPGYPGDARGYPGGTAGYPGGRAGYPDGAAGYPGGAARYPTDGSGQAGGDPFGTGPFGTDRGTTGPFGTDLGGTDLGGTGPFTADRTGTGTGPFAFGQPGERQRPQGYSGGVGQPGRGQTGQAQAPRPQQSEEDIPEWAEPDSVEAFSERWRRRGLDSRDDRRSDRRKRRRMLFAGGGAAVVVIAVAVYFLVGGGSSATPGFGNLITSFLPGELQQVPDACNTVPDAMLNQYLNGTRKIAAPPLNTGANTECTWTLDSPPTYRVLEVQIDAYSPSALYGNGSATDAAELNYESFQQDYAKPGPKSGQPPATVTDLSGMPGGTQTSAFLATQVFNREGAKTDVANVLVRYRNVIITVVVDGLDQATGNKTYGPVSMSDLSSAAETVARQVAGTVVG
jgi:hypothetical protein